MEIIRSKCTPQAYRKTGKLNNQALLELIAQYVTLCSPKTIFVCNDSAEDRVYCAARLRKLAKNNRYRIKIKLFISYGYLDFSAR